MKIYFTHNWKRLKLKRGITFTLFGFDFYRHYSLIICFCNFYITINFDKGDE